GHGPVVFLGITTAQSHAPQATGAPEDTGCQVRLRYRRAMQVLIAPDGFGGTLRADEAARVSAVGWSAARPGDRVTVAPQSDGGPDFVAVLAAALPGAQIRTAAVTGPLGAQVKARWLWDDAGAVAYLESAQA